MGCRASNVSFGSPEERRTTPRGCKAVATSRKLTPPEVIRTAKKFIIDKGLDKLESPVKWRRLDDRQKVRFATLLDREVTWLPLVDSEKPVAATTFDAEFQEFRAVCKENWIIDYVFWDSEAPYLVICRQLSSNCYLHAVVTMVHYLVALSADEDDRTQDHKLIDLGWFIREHFTAEALREHIIHDRGGQALSTLKCILPTLNDSNLETYFIVRKAVSLKGFKVTTDLVLERFEELQRPGLVTNFLVEKNFKEAGEVSYDSVIAVQDDAPRFTHAMLLIGALRNQSGDVHFLLQNWWSGKYIIEVSAEYLASTGAKIIFAPQVEMSLPSNFRTVDAVYAEMETPLEGEIFDGPPC